MKIKILFIIILNFFCLVIFSQGSQQNLLNGWDNTGGTPYTAGWRVHESITVPWGNLNGSGVRFRTNVGSPANTGSNPMLYITMADTKFAYPVTTAANKIYQLSGRAWRRNGGTGSLTFNFYFADNLLATDVVSQASLTITGSNTVNTFNLRLAAPEDFTSGYMLWDAHLNSGTWDDAGIWLLELIELGNAYLVTFDTDGGTSIPCQYFLEGDSYKITKPADPSREGYIFKGWYSDEEFTDEYDFSSSITVNTTIYAQWQNLKEELINLIGSATPLLSGGTLKGQTYLNAKIAEAQTVVDNPSATNNAVIEALEALTTAILAYQDSGLSDLKAGDSSITGFSVSTYDYKYSVAKDASIPAVSATARVEAAASVSITQANNLPGYAAVTVTAGNGSTQVYKVHFVENLIYGWDGNGVGVASDKPNDFGWACTSNVTWINASDNNDTYAYRYRDNLGVGRVITHPQDNGVFSFPLQLEAGKIYRFNCTNANMNGTVSTMFGINTSRDAKGTMIASRTKTAPRWNETTSFDFHFAVKESGMYYLLWQTTNGTDRNLAWDFLITENNEALSVIFDTDGGSEVSTQYFAENETYIISEPEESIKEDYIFTGWYTDNTYSKPFNFGNPVSGNTTIYARFVADGDQTRTAVSYNNEIVSLNTARYMDITVSGKSELRFSASSPLINSTIDLVSEDSWLYFESVRPAVAISDWLAHIKVNGRPADPKRDRIAIYGAGTVVIPNGKEVGQRALIIYTGENFQGELMQLEYDKYYRDAELGNFDNKIRSFKLKKGYSCTFANNPNGTGHSRVFIANEDDLEVAMMPEGLEFASFVRVFRWEWVSKKGICNGSIAELTGSTWFNDWSAGGNTENPNFEFVPMRHNLGWDSFDKINSRKNVSHLLGYNEPDHTDQANCTPLQAIQQWPELFKSGLRLGSPTPDAIRKQWLVDFLALADKLNYRVDFVVGHMYWENRSGAGLKTDIANAVRDLYGNRPMWITEWNNGANWTNESWPNATGPQRDADLNIIYDEAGNEKIINRPLSPANAEKQLNWMKDVLAAFDESPYLERHSFYNWVQDARAIVLGNKLTPAGEYFAEYKSKPAFTRTQEYIHQWKIAPPLVHTELSNDCKSFILKWYDHNGETGQYYVLEKKKNSDSSFEPIITLYAGTDYNFGETIQYADNSILESAKYRVRAMSYKNTLSEYSDEVTFSLDPALTTQPVLSGEALSISILDLSWTKVDNARFYTLSRSADGINFEIIVDNTTSNQYTDKELEEKTPYFYRVTAVNSWGSTTSEVFKLSTKELTAPTSVAGIYAASGDARATLDWDFQYDVQFRIYRADEAEGSYQLMVDDLDATRYVDQNLTNGNTYYYKVEAFNREGSYLETTVYEVTPEDSRHAYYDFNENAGNIAHDQWGGFHGTLQSNATWETISSDTLVVSMASADKAYIKLADGLTSDLNDFTISMLIHMSSKSSRIFSFGENTDKFMVFMPNMRYKITCPAGTYDVTATGYTLPLEEWVHLTITQQGTTFKMYHDGIEFFSDNNATVKPSDMGQNTNNFLVRSHFSSDGYSSCKFDEFRIYNKALSADEIAALVTGSPLASTWSPEPGSTDWKSASNWSDGVPGAATKVTIAKASSYPVLTEETKITDIHFEAGAELGRQDLLNYRKAFVDYDFGTGSRSIHFRMLSNPLMEAFPGDFTFGGQPDSYIQTLQADDSGRGKWVALSGGNSAALTAGTGFALSLDPDKDADKGLGLSAGILRLPFFDSNSGVEPLVHPNHIFSAGISTFSNPYGTGSYTITRSENAYRLAATQISVVPQFGQSGANVIALVGNPFMTTIDFSRWQADNNTFIKDNYQIWTKAGEQEGYAGYSSEGNWGLVLEPELDNLIAPLQGFVVERNGQDGGSLNFNLTNITADKSGMLRKSAVSGNKIDIIAKNAKASVRTYMARKEGGSVQFSGRDARKLINSLTDVPEIYTLKSSDKGLIAVGANIFDGEDVEYPLGLATSYNGEITLTFSGMDHCASNVFFMDNVLNKIVNLSGLSNYNYTFNYTPATKEKEVLPADNRFSIRLTSVVSGIEDKLYGPEVLSVYAENGYICVLSNMSLISDVKLYNLSGTMVYHKSKIETISYKTSKGFGQGVYIVEVQTAKGVERKKIMIPNH